MALLKLRFDNAGMQIPKLLCILALCFLCEILVVLKQPTKSLFRTVMPREEMTVEQMDVD